MPKKSAVLVVLMSLLVPVFAHGDEVLRFSGYDWTVKSAFGGPGPNHWDPRNAFLDKQRRLHLKITVREGQWRCAELSMDQRLGFGRYQWQVVGRLDQLDANVVLGLFNYTRPDVGPDGTNEIDIEFARWGNVRNPPGNYNVWPAIKDTATRPSHHAGSSFDFRLAGGDTTHAFDWSSRGVAFESVHGHRSSGGPTFGRFLFSPQEALALIPQKSLPVHMNLWLFKGQPPLDGREVEIIISSFKFTAAAEGE